MAKWNEVLRIQQQLGSNTQFEGGAVARHWIQLSSA
mgnify:FL=1|jgi:hypothetical protein|tara:strand:+ start:816 stop:923 length:108 start_codon:yes stop_codon:yes gene_type:complete